MYPSTEGLLGLPASRRRSELLAERAVVIKLVDALLAAGFELSVNDGEEQHPWTTDRAAVFDAILNTDEELLRARKDGVRGSVLLIYGNSGWDVIADYSTSLEEWLAPINAFAETLEPRVDAVANIEVPE